MRQKLVEVHVFCFNPHQNGGESFILSSKIIDDGDDEPLLEQQLILNSYGNSTTLNIPNLTPQILRQLADELEQKLISAKENI